MENNRTYEHHMYDPRELHHHYGIENLTPHYYPTSYLRNQPDERQLEHLEKFHHARRLRYLDFQRLDQDVWRSFRARQRRELFDPLDPALPIEERIQGGHWRMNPRNFLPLEEEQFDQWMSDFETRLHAYIYDDIVTDHESLHTGRRWFHEKIMKKAKIEDELKRRRTPHAYHSRQVEEEIRVKEEQVRLRQKFGESYYKLQVTHERLQLQQPLRFYRDAYFDAFPQTKSRHSPPPQLQLPPRFRDHYLDIEEDRWRERMSPLGSPKKQTPQRMPIQSMHREREVYKPKRYPKKHDDFQEPRHLLRRENFNDHAPVRDRAQRLAVAVEAEVLQGMRNLAIEIPSRQRSEASLQKSRLVSVREEEMTEEKFTTDRPTMMLEETNRSSIQQFTRIIEERTIYEDDDSSSKPSKPELEQEAFHPKHKPLSTDHKLVLQRQRREELQMLDQAKHQFNLEVNKRCEKQRRADAREGPQAEDYREKQEWKKFVELLPTEELKEQARKDRILLKLRERRHSKKANPK